MLKYFNGAQLDKIQKFIPTAKKDVNSYVSFIAMRIIEKTNFDNLQIKDGVLIICDGIRVKEYKEYSVAECQIVAEEIKEELTSFFGVDLEVKFYIADTDEEEPDPIPPMYWGETDSVYYYSLTVKVKL
mgnify:CR=1 FL=1